MWGTKHSTVVRDQTRNMKFIKISVWVTKVYVYFPTKHNNAIQDSHHVHHILSIHRFVFIFIFIYKYTYFPYAPPPPPDLPISVLNAIYSVKETYKTHTYMYIPGMNIWIFGLLLYKYVTIYFPWKQTQPFTTAKKKPWTPWRLRSWKPPMTVWDPKRWGQRTGLCIFKLYIIYNIYVIYTYIIAISIAIYI